MTTEPEGLIDNEELGSTKKGVEDVKADNRETKTIEVRVDDTPKERPEGLPDAAWNIEKNEINNTALIEEYKKELKQKQDLRKALSKGKPEVPTTAEEYEITFDEETAKFIPDGDPATDIFKKLAHEQGLSKEQVQNIASGYMAEVVKLQQEQGVVAPQSQEEIEQENKKFRTEQMAILGDEGKRTMEAMSARIAALYEKGSLNEDDKEAYKNAAYDAKGVLFLQKLMSLPHDTVNFIPNSNVLNEGQATKEALDAMGADPRMETDPAFRKKRSDGYKELEARGAL